MANVDDTPVKPTCISTTDTEPIEDVIDNVSSIETGTKASPCDNVISKLVGVIITSGTSTEPTLDVIDKPVGRKR